jgi:hypothetical protein
MTNSQATAIWELCRQGFPLSADEAEESWERGQPFRPDWRIQLSRALRKLIDDCNRQVDGHWEAV